MRSVVSVVIPLFNKEKYIERAVRSVLSQTVEGFEIIVVNDGSTDNGGKIVCSIKDNRIRVICQENKGVSAARNKGIELSCSNLIAFLDADDAYEPNFLETILRLRKKYPGAGAYSTAYSIIKRSGLRTVIKYEAIPPSPWEGLIPNYFKSALGPAPVSSSSIAIPKGVFDKIGTFAINETNGEDLDMWFRVALKYSIAFSNNISATYFLNTENRAIFCDINPGEMRLFKTARKAIRTKQINPCLVPYINEYICKKKLQLAFLMISQKDKRIEARWILKKCFTKRFFMKKTILILLSFFPVRLIKSLYKSRSFF